MDTTVDVQHFPGYIASLRQVDDRIGDFLCVEDAALREQGLLKVLGISFTSGVSTTPGATALKRMLFLAYSLARLRVIAFRPPLVIIEIDAGMPAMGFSASAAVMLVTLPPVPCASICLTAS